MARVETRADAWTDQLSSTPVRALAGSWPSSALHKRGSLAELDAANHREYECSSVVLGGQARIGEEPGLRDTSLRAAMAWLASRHSLPSTQNAMVLNLKLFASFLRLSAMSTFTASSSQGHLFLKVAMPAAIGVKHQYPAIARSFGRLFVSHTPQVCLCHVQEPNHPPSLPSLQFAWVRGGRSSLAAQECAGPALAHPVTLDLSTQSLSRAANCSGGFDCLPGLQPAGGHHLLLAIATLRI
ncbi:hypothetical protein BKA80DRAFT_251688 [Phyllosticta citrichinensis]